MIKNITNTFFTRVVHSGITLLMIVIISRYLGAEVKGEQGLILSTISLLNIIMNVIGAGAIIYLIPRFSYTLLCATSYLWMVLVAIVFHLSWPYMTLTPERFTTHITLLSLLFSLSGFHVNVLIAREKIVLANTIVLIQIVIQLVALMSAICLFDQQSVYAYIYAAYTALILSYVIALILSRPHAVFHFQELSLKGIASGAKYLMRYGLFNQLDIFAQVLSFRFSYYLLALYLGNKEVGVYSIAVSIAESIWIIARSFGMVLYARVSNTSSFKRNAQTTLKVVKISTILTLLPLLTLLLLPANTYTVIFGKEFFAVKTILYFIAPGVLFFSASFLVGSFFSGSGKQHINTIASFAGLVVTAIFTFSLIPAYGFVGAAITASLSYVVTTMIKIYYFHYQSNISLQDYLIGKNDISLFLHIIRLRIKQDGPKIKRNNRSNSVRY